jgi:hypothetical protein
MVFTDQEIETLVMSLAKTREQKATEDDGDGLFTEEEAQAIVAWAVGARLEASMLECILEGLVNVDFVDGDVCYRISEKGKQRARELKT